MDAVRVLEDIPLAIDPDDVLRFQGYKAGVDVPSADVLALFDDALVLGRALMRPRAVLRTLPSRLASEWVFPNAAGTGPLDGRAFDRLVFRPALKRAGIRDLRWKDLRHLRHAIADDRLRHGHDQRPPRAHHRPHDEALRPRGARPVTRRRSAVCERPGDLVRRAAR